MTGEVLVARAEHVITLTLSNPSRRNAIDYKMYDALEREFISIARDPDVRAVVLRGAGGTFAGGTDIRHLVDITTGDAGVEYERHMLRVQERLRDLRVPVIAVVDGACIGGGLVLAALSDLVYCTPDAVFGSPIARTVGNTLSPTSIARLRECFGPRRTAEMLLTGRLLDAADALHSGFVNEIVPPHRLEETLGEVLERIRGCSMTTLWSFKEISQRIDVRASVDVSDVYRVVYGGEDFREGVSAFLSKRPANFVATYR